MATLLVVSVTFAWAFVRSPRGLPQLQVSEDEGSAVHLLYEAGDPAHGDLFALGTICGGQIAVGRGVRVHVA